LAWISNKFTMSANLANVLGASLWQLPLNSQLRVLFYSFTIILVAINPSKAPGDSTYSSNFKLTEKDICQKCFLSNLSESISNFEDCNSKFSLVKTAE